MSRKNKAKTSKEKKNISFISNALYAFDLTEQYYTVFADNYWLRLTRRKIRYTSHENGLE